MNGIWVDQEGRHLFVGEMSTPLADQPWADVIKFLESSGFTERETTGLPSSTGQPYSESTWEQRDRVVRLTQRLSPYGFPVIASASTSEGDSQSNPAPLNNIGDLVKFVTMGRSSNAPEKETILNKPQDALSQAIGSVYGKVEPVSIPSAYSAKSFVKIALAVQKWYPGCGTMGHTKKEEGCALCEELGPTAGILPTGVKPAEVAKSQTADVYRGQAQDPVAGGQEFMEQSRVNPAMGGLTGRMDDQSQTTTNPNKGGLNPMYGGQNAGAVNFEELMQSPAYTSDDGLDMWNTYKEGDLEPPDEVQITLDPLSGEVMFVSYEWENASQMPFMGTPAMPVNPFADSPQPTPLREEPQKQMEPAAGQAPSGINSAQMGQPHQPVQGNNQIPAPSASHPSQANPQKQPPQQGGQPQPQQPGQQDPNKPPGPLTQQQLNTTPTTPDWTSPDPTSNEEHAPVPGTSLQRSFRRFGELLKATHEHYAGELPAQGERGADVAKRLEAKGYRGTHFPGGSSTYAPGGSHVYTHDNGCHIRWTEDQTGKVDQMDHFVMGVPGMRGPFTSGGRVRANAPGYVHSGKVW